MKDILTPQMMFAQINIMKAHIEELRANIKINQLELQKKYHKASKKWDEMMRGEYMKSPASELPCPCCGKKTLKCNDHFTYSSNDCTSCGWGTGAC